MTDRLITQTSIREFFQQRIDEILKSELLEPNEATSAYLVDLLCEYATMQMDEILSQPLGLVMIRSETTFPTKALYQLKKVGDYSLYLLGFFNENLKKRRLDPNYYTTLGNTAYKQLSQVLRRQKPPSRLVVVYAELSKDFVEFVRILKQIRDKRAILSSLP